MKYRPTMYNLNGNSNTRKPLVVNENEYFSYLSFSIYISKSRQNCKPNCKTVQFSQSKKQNKRNQNQNKTKHPLAIAATYSTSTETESVM